MDVARARAILGVPAQVGLSEINRAFRRKVSSLAPSDAAGLEELLEAAGLLRGHLSEQLRPIDADFTLPPEDVIEVRALATSSKDRDDRDHGSSYRRSERGAGASALKDFRDSTVLHEHVGAPLPDALVRWAALAATATIVWGAIAIPLHPRGHWSQILYVLGDQAAWIAARSQQIAVGLVLGGFVLFVASLGLLAVRQERGRYLAAGHIGVSSLAALPGVSVVLIIGLNGLGIVLLGAIAAGFLYFVFKVLLNQ